MIDELIAILESKGLKEARAVVEELERGGAITPFDACKYVGIHRVIRTAATQPISTTRICGDVAYDLHLSETVLKELVRR